MIGSRRDAGSLRAWSGTIEMLFFFLALLLFLSALLACFAFTRPSQRTARTVLPYEHVGSFSYSGAAPSGVYDGGGIQAGDPLFPNLTCAMNVRFSYALAGLPADGLVGTYRLETRVLEPQSGWERTLSTTEERAFSRGSFTAQAPVNLCQAEALVAQVEAQTGWKAASNILRVTSIVRLSGTVDAMAVEDSFEPNLDFRFNPILFTMISDNPQLNPLNPSQAGALEKSVYQPNTLSILGVDYPVAGLRAASVVGTLVSVLGGLGLSLGLSSLTRGNRAVMLQIKYASLLVDAPQGPPVAARDMTDVASVEDLARIAERHSTMILVQRRDGLQHFSVQADGRTYHYALNDGAGNGDAGG